MDEVSENKEESKYKINVATPGKRFLAFIIDTTIIYIIISLFIFSFIKNDIKDIINNGLKNEISLDINNDNSITNIKNTTVSKEKIKNEEYTKITINNKTYEEMRKILVKKLNGNRLFRYTTFLIPLLYNIILLYFKKGTIGQLIFHLMVVRNDGNKLSFNDIMNRVCLFTIFKNMLLAPVTVILPVLFSKKQITAYDYLSDTFVIEVR